MHMIRQKFFASVLYNLDQVRPISNSNNLTKVTFDDGFDSVSETGTMICLPMSFHNYLITGLTKTIKIILKIQGHT